MPNDLDDLDRFPIGTKLVQLIRANVGDPEFCRTLQVPAMAEIAFAKKVKELFTTENARIVVDLIECLIDKPPEVETHPKWGQCLRYEVKGQWNNSIQQLLNFLFHSNATNDNSFHFAKHPENDRRILMFLEFKPAQNSVLKLPVLPDFPTSG